MAMARVLVAYASERGSTAEIAEAIGETLRKAGFDVEVRPAREVADVSGYRGVILGSAVYMMRWRKDAIGFLRRLGAAPAERHVWLFQSGPLDRSAEEKEIDLPKRVAKLAARVGIRGHATFGGRLAPDAKGFIASKMAKNVAGDHRNFDQIRAWAGEVGKQLAAAPAD